MYNPSSKVAEEFIDHQEILDTIEYAEANKNNESLITELIEKANIDRFTTSFTFRYSSSYGIDDYHVFFSKDGAYELEFENLFYCRLGGHSSYSGLFTLDGRVNATYPIGEKGAKTFLFVEHYEELEKDLIDALRKNIDTILKQSSEETTKANTISKDIDSLRKNK